MVGLLAQILRDVWVEVGRALGFDVYDGDNMRSRNPSRVKGEEEEGKEGGRS